MKVLITEHRKKRKATEFKHLKFGTKYFLTDRILGRISIIQSAYNNAFLCNYPKF